MAVSTEGFGLGARLLETPGPRAGGVGEGRCTCFITGRGDGGRKFLHDCPCGLQSLPPGRVTRHTASGRRAQALQSARRKRSARLLLSRPSHANRRASCRAGLHGGLRRGRVSSLPAGGHPVLELRRHAPLVDGRPRDAGRRGPRAPARDERADAALGQAKPVPPAASVGHPLADAHAARRVLTRVRPRGDHRASWKIRPSVKRSPERTSLTPCRTFAR